MSFLILINDLNDVSCADMLLIKLWDMFTFELESVVSPM